MYECNFYNKHIKTGFYSNHVDTGKFCCHYKEWISCRPSLQCTLHRIAVYRRDCVDNCTISATDVTWVWKHLTQGFFCQLFCVCRTQRTKDLNLLLFSTRLAKAHRFKVCLKHKVRSNLFFIICFIKGTTKGTDLQC